MPAPLLRFPVADLRVIATARVFWPG